MRPSNPLPRVAGHIIKTKLIGLLGSHVSGRRANILALIPALYGLLRADHVLLGAVASGEDVPMRTDTAPSGVLPFVLIREPVRLTGQFTELVDELLTVVP